MTQFTYQGELRQSGAPANGEFDFRILLYDSATDGDYFGVATFNEEPVTNGLFTVTLDFGAQPFMDQARWLEIQVRPGVLGGLGGYTTLTPRQPLDSAPHSLSTRGIRVSPDGKVGLGDTAPEVSLHVHGGGLLVHDDAGEGVSVLSSDIRFDAPQGDTVYHYSDVTDKHEFFTGLDTAVQSRLVIASDGNVGIGAQSPSSRLTVDGTIENTSGGFKFPDGSVQTVASPWQINADGDAVVSSGRIGIGTISPQGTLEVNAPAGDASVQLPASSISAAECGNEPGIASTRMDVFFFPIEITPTDVAEQSINCPSDGYLLILATCTLSGFQATVNNVILLDGDLVGTVYSSIANVSFAMQRVTPVTTGAHVIDWNANRVAGQSASAGAPMLTVMFFPTAYGPVTP